MAIEKTGIIQPDIFKFTLGQFEISTLLDGIVQRDGPHPIFGENQNNFSEQLTLGNFVTQPIIGKLDIDVKGPLTKAQRSRLSSCLEQFFANDLIMFFFESFKIPIYLL